MPTQRINFILVVILVLSVVIIGQLFNLQILKGSQYRAWAQGSQSKETQIIAERGEVFFRNGEPLAINIDWISVFISPIEVKEKELVATKLSEILSIDRDIIVAKLSKNSLYESIKKKISEEEFKQIKELNLSGVNFSKDTGRYYPQENLASQLIGFLDSNQEGQYGIEGYYNQALKGKRDEKGGDIYLTVDYSIQFKAEKLLEEAKENLNIRSGQIIVLNPNSGEIIALANFPNFNPNNYSNVSNIKIFENAVTQETFEPGSIFKPLTMLGALEEQKVTPQTTYIDKGMVKVGGWPIYNYDNRVYGETSMTEVLEKSINTGIVFAEQQLGHNLFLKYLDKLEVLKPSGVDLSEVTSLNKEFREGREINFTTASFGQGIEMTPIQLIKAFTAITNDGRLVTPYIVKKGTEPIKELVVSSKTANQLTTMLVSVTENGFAKSARVPGYYVAGKTGTAQIPFVNLGVDKRGYSDETWQSFIGFAPAFDPRFLILVKLDNPETRTAEYSAVPIFQNLAKFIIDYYQIPPDY